MWSRSHCRPAGSSVGKKIWTWSGGEQNPYLSLKCLNIVGVGDLQKELRALPLSLHIPGPRMGEAEEDTIGSGEASTQYCPVPTHWSSWSVTSCISYNITWQPTHQSVCGFIYAFQNSCRLLLWPTLNGTIQGGNSGKCSSTWHNTELPLKLLFYFN